MLEANYKLRRAVTEDSEVIWKIRNREEVRENSLNKDFIELENHMKWFENNLRSPISQLLVLEDNGRICGVIRFDMMSSEAEISLYLDPDYFGKGIGKFLLTEGIKWLRTFEPNVKTMTAKILPENERSQKLFAKLGFVKEHNIWVRRI